jgi:hypothetical protein
MTTLQAIGYWRDHHTPIYDRDLILFPHPKELVTKWDPEVKARTLAYLRSGHTLNSWCGFSYCRFKGGPPPVVMGNRTLTDGVWAWPEGLAVYVDLYDVGLPGAFLADIAARGHEVPREVDIDALRRQTGGHSFDVWFRWCTFHRRNRFLAFLARLLIPRPVSPEPSQTSPKGG